MITNWGKKQVALAIGGSTINFPSRMLIGSGTTAASVGDLTLQKAWDSQAVTSTSYSTAYKIKWQGDWSTSEMNGSTFSEWAMLPSGGALTGSIWSRTVVPTITFDGTNELRIEENWIVY